MPIPSDRAAMVVRLDAMLETWRSMSDAVESARHVEPKPPAVYAIGLIDYADLVGLDSEGATRLIDEVTWRLDRLVRSGDELGMIEQDVFLLAAAEMAPSTAGSVMDRVRGALAMPIELADDLMSLDVAIGVSFAFDGGSGEDMIDAAESDMRRAMGARG